jgi:hypothetical protein
MYRGKFLVESGMQRGSWVESRFVGDFDAALQRTRLARLRFSQCGLNRRFHPDKTDLDRALELVFAESLALDEVRQALQGGK